MSHDTTLPCSALSQAVVNLFTQTTTTDNAAFELGRVLGQNSILESDFNQFVEKTRGLFRPNKTGALLRSKIIDAETESVKIGTFSLVPSHSLAHRLAMSEDHFWIVSTIVTCLKGQPLLSVMQILGGIIFPELEAGKALVSDFMPAMLVLWKVMLDIVANISNACLKYDSLPRPLSELCDHAMSSSNFDRVIKKIKQSNRCKTIKTDKFYANLTSWLLHHFHGSITISIAGKEIYSSRLCDCSQSLNMVVENLCDCRYKVYRKRGSVLKQQSHVGKRCDALFTAINKMPVVHHRSDKQVLYGLSSVDWCSKKEFDQIMNVGKDFWSWLLNRRVRLQADASSCVFELVRDLQESKDGTIQFRNMLSQSPRRWRDIPENPSGDWVIFDREFDFVDINTSDRLVRMCRAFPEISNLLESFRGKCECDGCSKQGTIEEILPGCIWEDVLELLLFCIKFDIAETFGVEKFSPLSANGEKVLSLHSDDGRQQDDVPLILSIMLDLALDRIVWSKWFVLASSCALGHDSLVGEDAVRGSGRNRIIGQDEEYDITRSRSVVAVQYGAQLAIAPWFDVAQPTSLNGSFTLKVHSGKLVDREGCTVFLSVFDKFEITPIEQPDRTDVLPMLSIPKDSADVSMTNVVLHKPESSAFFVFTNFQTNSTLRTIDPLQALGGLSQSIYSSCHCGMPRDVPLRDAIPDASVHTFDYVLGTWSNVEEDQREGTYVTLTLSTHAQLNATLSLCLMGSVILEQGGCFRCCAQEVEQLPRASRRVISVTKELWVVKQT